MYGTVRPRCRYYFSLFNDLKSWALNRFCRHNKNAKKKRSEQQKEFGKNTAENEKKQKKKEKKWIVRNGQFQRRMKWRLFSHMHRYKITIKSTTEYNWSFICVFKRRRIIYICKQTIVYSLVGLKLANHASNANARKSIARNITLVSFNNLHSVLFVNVCVRLCAAYAITLNALFIKYNALHSSGLRALPLGNNRNLFDGMTPSMVKRLSVAICPYKHSIKQYELLRRFRHSHQTSCDEASRTIK